MTLVCDAGALIAIERNEPAMWRRLKAALRTGTEPVTHGAVVGQVWRGGARQALLARALAGIEVAPVDARLGRQAGVLLGKAATDDVVDAAIVALAVDGDRIVTSDPHHILALVGASGMAIEVVAV